MTVGGWSAPETDVMANVGEALDGDRAVLATVVAVEGSAYRRPGAKMVIGDGDGVGAVTAGCLEDEIVALAREVLDCGQPRVERFDLTAGDDVWGLGVGCNGVIDVLLEPLAESYRPVVEAYQSGKDTVVLTVVDGDGTPVERGDRTVVFPAESGASGPCLQDTDWPDELLTALEGPTNRLLSADASDTVSVRYEGDDIDIFVDCVTAPPELVVFGSGRDVAPVARSASEVGFRVTVVTFRGGAATADRFPAADRVVSTSPADLRDVVSFDAETYAVLMTHNFVDDRIALTEVLDAPTEYVGLLGPRKRFEELRSALAEDGHHLTDDELDRVYTPVGLDLGGGTPLHVAQSIVAEVTAVHHDRSPNHLTERAGPIHSRSPVGVEPSEFE
ncbi:XdhC family protein [Halorientalis pallida]|uniref:XdhC/CoxI family protein n=1 Tax=Halorientalis pallida TaxID=2479928 RepID=A0A498L0F9_9EURY|nr:XdhC/CoxI family protein [Halorientalis pallida]RXK47983.1 XdhC/CoxI family protein [Halorientalis pallida]